MTIETCRQCGKKLPDWRVEFNLATCSKCERTTERQEREQFIARWQILDLNNRILKIIRRAKIENPTQLTQAIKAGTFSPHVVPNMGDSTWFIILAALNKAGLLESVDMYNAARMTVRGARASDGLKKYERIYGKRA